MRQQALCLSNCLVRAGANAIGIVDARRFRFLADMVLHSERNSRRSASNVFVAAVRVVRGVSAIIAPLIYMKIYWLNRRTTDRAARRGAAKFPRARQLNG